MNLWRVPMNKGTPAALTSCSTSLWLALAGTSKYFLYSHYQNTRKPELTSQIADGWQNCYSLCNNWILWFLSVINVNNFRNMQLIIVIAVVFVTLLVTAWWRICLLYPGRFMLAVLPVLSAERLEEERPWERSRLSVAVCWEELLSWGSNNPQRYYG